MFPWTGASKNVMLRRAEKMTARSVEQGAEDIAKLRKRYDAETTFDGVLLDARDRLSKARIARAVDDASTPEGFMELRRVWREVDRLMGPGKSVLETLIARYVRLQGTVARMGKLLRRGLRVRGKAAKALVLREMDAELKMLASAKKDIVDAVEMNTAAVKAKLKADLGEEATRKLKTLTDKQVRDEVAAALDELEQSFQSLRKAAEKGVDGRPSKKILERIAEEKVILLNAVGGEGPRSVLPSRIRTLAKEFGDPTELGPAFAKELKRDVSHAIPALEEIDDTSLMFMEALGAVGQATPNNAELLRRYVERGAHSLKKPKEREAVQGFLGQLRGLMPEEVATHMKFMEGVFHKRAFEVLADFPPLLREQMGVEMVHGPLWVADKYGVLRQFGDGCMLLTGPKGQSAILGLGEFKAGFDEDLMQQLFTRSDGRAVDAMVQFTGADGKLQSRRLTREFAFENGKKVSVSQPPVYVYGRPVGEAPEEAAAFEKMVQEEMRSGREVWKMDLPFSAKANEQFAERTLRLAVKFLSKKKPEWGIARRSRRP